MILAPPPHYNHCELKILLQHTRPQQLVTVQNNNFWLEDFLSCEHKAKSHGVEHGEKHLPGQPRLVSPYSAVA